MNVTYFIKACLFLIIILFSCKTTQKLPSGRWSGYVSPTDQPDRKTYLNYEVEYQEQSIAMEINGPGGINFPTQDLALTNDTLFFAFNRYGRQEILTCALKKVNKSYYYGLCSDSDGKSAVLTMKHSSIDLGIHYGIQCDCHK